MQPDARGELRVTLAELAQAKRTERALDERLRSLEDEWRSRFERQHAVEIAQRAEARRKAAELEERAKELAVQIAQESGDKAPARGVRVRVKREVEYDTGEAVRWALERGAAEVLALAGRRAFLGYLKEHGLRPNFVEEKEVYQAMITKELLVGADPAIGPAEEEHHETSNLPF